MFAGNGFRCPLTELAERYGAQSGWVTDIYLPRWFAHNMPAIRAPLLVLMTYLPLAALGFLSPLIAGAAKAFSSVFVVSNSLLLRRFQPRAAGQPDNA